MKRVIMWKWQACRTQRWGWSVDEVYDDWNNVYSDPYYVEIPEDFSLGETVMGETMYFRDGERIGYEVVAMSDGEDCMPHLIGGSPVRDITLTVIGPAEED